MACGTSISAFCAFESQLRTLCLQEFPCGLGSWKENYGQRRKIVEKDKVNSRFLVTLKDYGALYEKTETLEELVTAKDSPWNLDYSWSDEAKDLREIAVRSPWLIDERFVLRHFKTLRIVDKQVEEVDVHFLKFQCLEELSLSANMLRTVHSINLPSSLRVLELCANRISHLADLCVKPPPLIHLGLGYNHITLVDDYITGQHWPHLLSLDLSHNNLADMMDLVKKLQTLPKLGNLILQGNPLALIPAYRGYVIDSLKRLNFLDDISISADEKHHYKGLSKRREYILDEGEVTLTADYIRGVPMPDEMKNPDDQPEFPVITRKYFIQFHYPEDKLRHAEIYQILQDDQFSMLSPSQTQDPPPETLMGDSPADVIPTQAPAHNAPEIKIEKGTTRGSSVLNDQLDQMSNMDGAVTMDDIKSGIHRVNGTSGARGSPSLTCLSEDLDDADHQMGGARQDPLQLAPINSDAVPWAEEILLDWTKVVSRDDLTALRDFFRQGMDISVIEEKVRSYPADQMENGAPTPLGSIASKMSPKKEKKDDKASGGKGGKPDKSVASGDKKKKKGEPDVEMVDMPAEFTTLHTFHIQLSDLLEGERYLEKQFMFDWESDPGTKTPVESEDSKKDGKKEKKRRTSANSRGGKAEKDRGKSPKPDKKDVKDKKALEEKSKSKSEVGEGEEMAGAAAQPPLEISVSIRLHHWKTALDSLKPDTHHKPPEEDAQ